MTADQLRRRRWLTVVVMMATIMQALDGTIANVALPDIQGSLSATSDQITWVLTSYVVAAAIFTAPVGWLAAHFGRKRLFLVCVVGFTAASALCGMATSLGAIVAFRLLQGMFGAALVPLSQATMLDLYPPEQRGSAMALWGVGVMIGPILGPTLGGYLTDTYDWRWVFLINVPFGILASIGLIVFMRETSRHHALRFDWIAASTGITAFLYSMKSPRWLSSSSPIGGSRLIGSLAILRTLRTFSSGIERRSASSSGVASRPVS